MKYSPKSTRPNQKPHKKIVSIRVDEELLNNFKAISKEKHIKQVDMWEYGMRKAIEKYKKG